MILQAENAVICWDTKYFPDLTGDDRVDHIPILISQESGDQLLGIPKLATATGSSTAEAVYDSAAEWKTLDRIVGMCF